MTSFLPDVAASRPVAATEDLAEAVRRYRKLCGMHVMRHRRYHAAVQTLRPSVVSDERIHPAELCDG
jgi:hypothetical protein